MTGEGGRPRQLGRGLEALFGEDRTNLAAADPDTAGAAGGLRTVAIGQLVPNPLQPRRYFDDGALADLANSIREKGILQPLIVRPSRRQPGSFEIVAGERRWRAAQRAQVHEAPVIVRDFSDEEALAVALIENIQRDELTPIEEAEAYQRLARDFHRTQEQVAEVVGKSRSHVANTMRLLELPEDVRAMLAEGRLSPGHARAILRAPDPAALAREIVAEGLTVRDAEALGRRSRGKRGARGRTKRTGPAKDADTLALERELGNILGLKVDVAFDGKAGRLTLHYNSLEQLDDLIERLTGQAAGPQRGGTAPGPDYDPDDDLDPDDPFGDDGPPSDGTDPPGRWTAGPPLAGPLPEGAAEFPENRDRMRPDPDRPDSAETERPDED